MEKRSSREIAQMVLAQMEQRGAEGWRVEEVVDEQYILVGDCTQKSTRGSVRPLSIVSEASGDLEMGRIFGIEDEHTHRLLVWCIDSWHVYEEDRLGYREYTSRRSAEKRLVAR